MAQWGDKLEFLEDIEDSGGSPHALQNRPQLFTWMEEFVEAFKTLSKTRSHGFGPNPIPLTEILAYLQLYGSSDIEAFIEYVLEMDAEFLTVIGKKAKEESENGSKSSP